MPELVQFRRCEVVWYERLGGWLAATIVWLPGAGEIPESCFCFWIGTNVLILAAYASFNRLPQSLEQLQLLFVNTVPAFLRVLHHFEVANFLRDPTEFIIATGSPSCNFN